MNARDQKSAWLREQNYEVFSIYDQLRGADNEAILRKAQIENYILITNDKDFGALIFQKGQKHKGIKLLRLENEKIENKIAVLSQILEKYTDKVSNHFIIASEKIIRIS